MARIAEAEDYDEIKWMLDEPVTNFSMSVVDDFIMANIMLHYDMGLHPKIVRKEAGKCCDWCHEIVGSYDYPDDVPDDIYEPSVLPLYGGILPRKREEARCMV